MLTGEEVRMQSLKRILITTVACLLLLLAIGFLLPSTWHAERTVVIRAPAADRTYPAEPRRRGFVSEHPAGRFAAP